MKPLTLFSKISLIIEATPRFLHLGRRKPKWILLPPWVWIMTGEVGNQLMLPVSRIAPFQEVSPFGVGDPQ